eukprot:scaffold186901_cov28-Tisochrysis_lutea.AAC.2
MERFLVRVEAYRPSVHTLTQKRRRLVQCECSFASISVNLGPRERNHCAGRQHGGDAAGLDAGRAQGGGAPGVAVGSGGAIATESSEYLERRQPRTHGRLDHLDHHGFARPIGQFSKQLVLAARGGIEKDTPRTGMTTPQDRVAQLLCRHCAIRRLTQLPLGCDPQPLAKVALAACAREGQDLTRNIEE